MWSFAAPAPNSPFQVPAIASSGFPACPAAWGGVIALSTRDTASATNVAKRQFEITSTGLGVSCLSVLCHIRWGKTPPRLFQQAFRFLRPDVQPAESSRGWLLVVKVFFEAFFDEAGADKFVHLRPCQRPRQLSDGLVRLPSPDNRQQLPSRLYKRCDSVNRLFANLDGKGLDCVCLEDEIKRAFPFSGRLKQIGHTIFDSALWKTLVCHANGCFRDVESRRFESPRRQLLRVIPEPARNHEGLFPVSRQWVGLPEFKKIGIRPAVGPRHNAFARFSFLVKYFKPSARIPLSKELRRQLSRSLPVYHSP